MLRIIVIGLISLIMLPAAILSLSDSPEAWAQSDRTDLMQQSDHKSRSTTQAEDEPVKQQAAGIVPLENGTGDGDYLVLALLVASVVIMAFVASRKSGPRRKSRRRA
jgi:hypothetical protein